MICWALWKYRNELVWNQKFGEAAEVIALAVSVHNQWCSAQDNYFDTFLGFMTQEDGVEHWNTPSVSKIKVNTYAVIFELSKCFSFSVVAVTMKEFSWKLFFRCTYGSVSPEMAEATGIRETLSWVKKSMQGKDLWWKQIALM